ncbi:MAG: hypothetical protein AAFQ80_14370 [Cyanobacteria bacterium J06621_8]
MGFINEIITNFQEWHCEIFEDGSSMHSRRFSGEIHARLKKNFKSAYSMVSQENQTIVISCFLNYSNIAILSKN